MIDPLVVVGLGLIGGSVALACRERGLAREVIGIDPDPATRAMALERGAVDRALAAPDATVAGAGLVILACPVRFLGAALDTWAAAAPQATLTDVGSVKVALTARGAALGGRFVPGHPMAGSERGGIAHARADLFVAAPWILTPDLDTDLTRLAQVRALVEALGARPVTLTPGAHDQGIASTSHLTHLLAYALVATANELEIEEALRGPSFRSATRVAASRPAMWRDICLSNREALLTALTAFQGHLGAMQAALEADDPDALLTALEQGHRLTDS